MINRGRITEQDWQLINLSKRLYDWEIALMPQEKVEISVTYFMPLVSYYTP